jgi:undecaprenyl-diphosphatase
MKANWQLSWLPRAWEPRAIGSLCVILGCAWGFVLLAGEVMEGETHALDERILQALRSTDDPTMVRGPHWLGETMRDLTALGGYPVLVLTTLGVAGYLFLSGHRLTARFVLTAVVGGWIVSYGLKSYFDRPRPEIVPHLSVVHSSSFPSGHSIMSAVVYLTLGSLLTTIVPTTRLKCYFLCAAGLLTLLVGLSRLWMGVHYPSDVLAGWCVGLAWAELCWLAHSQMVRRWKNQNPKP